VFIWLIHALAVYLVFDMGQNERDKRRTIGKTKEQRNWTSYFHPSTQNIYIQTVKGNVKKVDRCTIQCQNKVVVVIVSLSCREAYFSKTVLMAQKSLNSTVGTETGYGVRVHVVSRIFSVPRRPYRLWGPPNLLIQYVPGGLSPGVKQQEHEVDHSLPTSSEFKKTWTYTSTPPYVFMAECLNS
jgi:hypothetical protein